MSTQTTEIEYHHVTLPAGPARAATFRRVYRAPIDDVWSACTDPARLARWYAPVEGDLATGGSFTQGAFGSGVLVECEAPQRLVADLGGDSPASDRVELRLRAIDEATTELEFTHATTRDSNDIGGQVFDAVYCMGGGYGPRLLTLGLHLDGTLPHDVDVNALHLREDMLPAIEEAMATLATQIQADGGTPVR